MVLLQGRLVSVVDDDESLRGAVKNLLTSNRIRVVTFESAEAFLASDALREAACLVLDLRLPAMSGLELLARLPKSISVVVLTAHDDIEMRRRALGAGAVAFLTKPFRASEFLDIVGNAIGSHAE